MIVKIPVSGSVLTSALTCSIQLWMSKLEEKMSNSPCLTPIRADYDTADGEIHDNVKNETT